MPCRHGAAQLMVTRSAMVDRSRPCSRSSQYDVHRRQFRVRLRHHSRVANCGVTHKYSVRINYRGHLSQRSDFPTASRFGRGELFNSIHLRSASLNMAIRFRRFHVCPDCDASTGGEHNIVEALTWLIGLKPSDTRSCIAGMWQWCFRADRNYGLSQSRTPYISRRDINRKKPSKEQAAFFLSEGM